MTLITCYTVHAIRIGSSRQLKDPEEAANGFHGHRSQAGGKSTSPVHVVLRIPPPTFHVLRPQSVSPLLLSVMVMFISSRHHHLLLLAVLWFCSTLLPASGRMARCIGTQIGDRFGGEPGLSHVFRDESNRKRLASAMGLVGAIARVRMVAHSDHARGAGIFCGYFAAPHDVLQVGRPEWSGSHVGHSRRVPNGGAASI